MNNALHINNNDNSRARRKFELCLSHNIFYFSFLPVPKNAPGLVKGYPLNSSAAYIWWERIPPTKYKEKLLGYRIRYNRIGSQSNKEMKVTSNVTEAVINGLPSATRYQIKVNGFNKVGHGPTSKILELNTLSSGK